MQRQRKGQPSISYTKDREAHFSGPKGPRRSSCGDPRCKQFPTPRPIGFLTALYNEVSPVYDDFSFNTIVGPRFQAGYKANVKSLTPQQGQLASGEVEYLTVDSGACDSVSHPASFPNTHSEKTDEYGKVYGACGGEAVQNIGTKHPVLLTKEGKLVKHTFQIGNKITKHLLAVSKLCEQGLSVHFGPAPAYES